MSKIEELLKDEKVEWKIVSDICAIKRGRVLSKVYLEEHKGKFPVYSSQTLNNGQIGSIDTYDFDGNYVTWTTDGAYAGTIFYRFGKFSITNICGILSPLNSNYLNIKYLLYWLQIEAKKHVTGGSGNPKLMSNVMAKIKVPIPKISIQNKIVEILDNFTNYVTELQKELQNRSKQYSYYRDKLLSEDYLNYITKQIEQDRELKKVKLNEIVTIKNGKDWKNQETGNIPVYGSGGPMGVYVDKCMYDKPTVLIPRKGSIENVFFLDKPFWNVDTVFYTIINEKFIMPKYFYYFVENYDLKKLSTDSTRPSLTQSILNEIIIPLPELTIQQRIVNVLDKFSSLLENTEGLLPDEILKRQKQYEYYREKLLTFDCISDKSVSQSVLLISKNYISSLIEAESLVGIENIVRKVKLCEIGTFENGTGMPKSMFKENGTVGAIHYGHIYTKYGISVTEPIVFIEEENSKKLKKVNYGDIVIAKTSENVEDVMKSVAYLGKDDVVVGGHAAIFKHSENPKYISYVFNGYNKLKKQKNKLARGVKVIELSISDMEKIEIPLPNRHVQDLIVSKLEKFELLTNSLVEGLPREIELRQKQYEYYREKLLNFESES